MGNPSWKSVYLNPHKASIRYPESSPEVDDGSKLAVPLLLRAVYSSELPVDNVIDNVSDKHLPLAIEYLGEHENSSRRSRC